MRVLMLDGGDRTPYLSRLMMRLAARGLTVHYAGDPRYKDFGAMESAGVGCHEVHIRHKIDRAARKRIRGLLDEHGIEILHTITSRDAYAGIKARGKSPVRVVVRRGAYAPISRFDPADRVIYGKRGADVIITVSRDLERHMIGQGIAAGRIRQVYTGIWSEELEARNRDLRSEFGVAPEALLLGYVGNDRRVKGFDVLVGAMEQLAARGVPAHLLVAGEGYDTGRAYPDNLTLIGFVDGIAGFTPNLDAFVIPSRIDALPRCGHRVDRARYAGDRHGRGGHPGDPRRGPRRRAGAARGCDGAGRCDRARARGPGSPARLADNALARNRELFDLDRCAAVHEEIYRGLQPHSTSD